MTSQLSTGMLLGYARTDGDRHPLAPQIGALIDAGVERARVYQDDSTESRGDRPGLGALLDYARAGDTTVVAGIDRLGRTVAEVTSTVRELSRRHIGIRSLREGIDPAESSGRMIVAVLASLGELDDEATARRRPRPAPRPDGTSIGRPRALDDEQIVRARRMRAAGEPVPAIAAALGVSRATLYRSLAERRSA